LSGDAGFKRPVVEDVGIFLTLDWLDRLLLLWVGSGA